jgi:hypothetical protein
MMQDAGISESQAMLISGRETRAMLERYNIVSLKNVRDAGSKLDAGSKAQTSAKTGEAAQTDEHLLPYLLPAIKTAHFLSRPTKA